MSTPTIIKYPYDPTGTAASNLVQDERHVIPLIKNRAFALHAGPFFANSVVVRTLPGNQVLVKGVDYETLYTYQEATRKVGNEITAVVFVINAAISGELSVDYQVLGGEFSSNVAAIQYLIESLEIDNRSIVWDDIIDRPVTFPPAPHLHHVGDLYGMEALIAAIEDLKLAIENSGGDTMYQDLYDAVSALTQRVAANESSISNLRADVDGFLVDLNALLQRILTLETDVDTLQQSLTTIQVSIQQILLRLNNLELVIPGLESDVATLQDEMVVLANQVTDIQQQFNALLLDQSYVLVGGTWSATVDRRRYMVTTAGTGTLPPSGSVPLGHCLYVSHVFEIEPVYQVANPGTETIRYKDMVDTSIRHDVKESIVIVKTQANVWSVFV